MNNIKKYLERSIRHLEANFPHLAIADIKDALAEVNAGTDIKSATTIEYYNSIKQLIIEKYGSEGYDAFCLGAFLILKSKGHDHDLTDFLKEALCDS